MVRPRLHHVIDDGVTKPLTLLTSLPGSGKTTVLTSWLAAKHPKPWLAWLTVESQDSDETRFWAHVLASIQLALPPRHRQAFSSITPPPPGGGDRFQARLIKAVGSLPRELIFVVDDAQEIVDGDAARGLERLVWLAPEQLRVVVSTSSDLHLSLPRLRARGDVVELRADELAFQPKETSELMNGLGVHLRAEQALVLTHRTEGWAAALRLASISLRDAADRDEFIRDFAFNDRTIADYLVEEVLGRIPDELRNFLLRTSIVDRFTRDLAAALTEDDEAGKALESLERDYSLVVPFGDGGWYRYHRLLARILPVLLAYEHPDDLRRLHGIAARWFGEHAMVSEAAHHATETGDSALVSRSLEDVSVLDLTGPESIRLRSVASRLSEERATQNQAVAVTLAGARLGDGDPEGALRLLDRGRRAPVPRRPHLTDRVRMRSMAIAAVAARDTGDVKRVLEETRTSLGEVGVTSPEERRFLEAVHHADRGWALLWSGQSDEARAELEEGIAAGRASRAQSIRLDSHAQLALLEMMLGRVNLAHDLARSALRVADDLGLAARPEAAAVYLALAWVHDERGEPDAVEGFLEAGREALTAGDLRDIPTSAIEACLAARVHGWRGRANVGANLLSATRRRMTDRVLNDLVGFVVVEEASLHLAAGAPVLATKVLERAPRGSRSTGQVAIRARLLRADGDDDGAVRLLRGHLDRDPTSHLPDLVDAWILLAGTLGDGRDPQASWEAEERALHLAEANGIFRPFLLQEGQADLLRTQLTCGTGHEELCLRLVDAIEVLSPAATPDPLVEPLSERERTVLRTMATLLSVEEIAAELFVSVNTVKTHVKHIYRKLGVGRRRDAVERGRMLHLVAEEPAAARPA